MKVKLGDVCEINPKRTPEDLSMNVSFIPMQSVSEQGDIDTSDIRSIKEVCKGFTAFVDGDVLMAKITPCMENGKGAIASGLHNGIGYGSTEFHVLRPNRDLVRSGWIYYLTKGKLFRINCEKNMTGSAGQKRVPKSYLQRYPIPLPSLAEQDKKITLLNRLRQIIILYKSQLQKLDELVKSRFMELMKRQEISGEGKRCKLGALTKIQTGKLDANASSPNGEYPFFTCSKDTLRIDSYSYDCECVLLAGNGEINAKYYDGKFDAYQRTYIIQSNDKSLLLVPFLYRFMEQYVATLQAQAIGGVIKYIKMGNLTEADIVLPKMEVQDRFVAFANQIDKSKFAVRRTLDKTQQLFDSLMQEYFG